MNPTISGYTTSYNCLDRRYPVEECIRSLLGFCDEVVVADAGSEDGTLEALERLQKEDPRLKVYVEPVDFSHPRWAIHMDGYLKAKARAKCTKDYCWQTDTDEIVAPENFEKVRALPIRAQEIFKEVPIIFLPMVEFWGSFNRIRSDFFSWKLRLSVNDPRIIHGIPTEHRMVDDAGFEYPRPFDSDSCNYIYSDTKESVRSVVPIPVRTFAMPPEEYQQHFNNALEMLPSVLHVSWLNLKRKIEHYREFWPKFHASMYNLSKVDSSENNVMFNKPWADVSDADIKHKVTELEKLGPRSFHWKINPNVRGETMPFTRLIPSQLQKWHHLTGSF